MQKGLVWNMNILKFKRDRNPCLIMKLELQFKLFEVANAVPVYMHHDLRDLHIFDRFVWILILSTQSVYLFYFKMGTSMYGTDELCKKDSAKEKSFNSFFSQTI